MGERSLRDDGHGLSDVLGYVLVFSLVVTSVLVVTVGGLSAVENARDAERAQNAERAFDVVATNFGVGRQSSTWPTPRYSTTATAVSPFGAAGRSWYRGTCDPSR